MWRCCTAGTGGSSRWHCGRWRTAWQPTARRSRGCGRCSSSSTRTATASSRTPTWSRCAPHGAHSLPQQSVPCTLVLAASLGPAVPLHAVTSRTVRLVVHGVDEQLQSSRCTGCQPADIPCHVKMDIMASRHNTRQVTSPPTRLGTCCLCDLYLLLIPAGAAVGAVRPERRRGGAPGGAGGGPSQRRHPVQRLDRRPHRLARRPGAAGSTPGSRV